MRAVHWEALGRRSRRLAFLPLAEWRRPVVRREHGLTFKYGRAAVSLQLFAFLPQ